MTEIRAWLLRVTVCALAVYTARQLAPKGAVAEAVRFCGGLLLILSLLAPLTHSDFSALVPDFSAWQASREEQRAIYEAEYAASLEEGIARRAAAYIEDKAAQMGISVRAEVVFRGEAMQGAVLTGTYSEALARCIETELGIGREKQEWREGP